MNPQALFAQAASLHQQGKLAEAERLYQQLLQIDPANAPGQHLLGVLRSQQGRNKEAIQLIGGALKSNPKDFGAMLNYGLVLQRERMFDEALASYEFALVLKPDFVEALFNRGVLLSELKQFDQALASYDKALALRPNYTEAHYNRGTLLSEHKRFEDALASFDRALTLNPRLVGAMDNRGNALRGLKRYDEAIASYDRALALDPRHSGALYNRGVTFLDMERFEDAAASFAAALAIKPDLARAHLSQGIALWTLGRPREALASYDRAVASDPGLADAWHNRGFLYYAQRQFADALVSYDRVLALEPGHAQAWNGRGSALQSLGRTDEALAAFGRAIALKPDYAEAFANRAILHWRDRKDYDAALADLEHVVTIDPQWPYARGELVHLRMQGCDWSGLEKQIALIDAGVRAGKRVVRPFIYQAVSQSPVDLLACSKIFAADLYPAAAPLTVKADRGHAKIRIGYVSGEFRDQATAHLMAGLYEQHNRNAFEITAFDTGWSDNGPMRKRLEAAFDKFIDISKLSDEEAARRVLAEEIDILVNLGGYFGDQRMGVFARRPAPVQVNYLGFPATLGADYIDYIIADRIVIPNDERKFYTEQVARLPDSYQANDSRRAIADITQTRAGAGLPDAAFVFCNFNQSYKLTPGTFAAWMRILDQVPGSVLWLWQSQREAVENLRREAVRQGVAGDRLIFAQGLPAAQHRARLRLADLFLDSLPYNAHTTASDALWAGLPLLTCRGHAFPGRVAASLLYAAGLSELVTETMAEYETRAVALARDPALLKSLRDRLAQNRLTCPLFDTERFRRNIEVAFAQMWDMALRGVPPRGFDV